MTVSTETARSGPYLGNGVAVSFAYSFRILDEAHLRVTTVDSAGRETVLTLETDYSVAGVGDAAGGSVILAAPLASGAQLVITRELPATQETDLENQGAFFAQTIEDALDKLTMLVQEGAEVDSRTLILPITSTGVSASLPGVAPNNVIGWNAAGTALENKVPNDGTVLPALLSSLRTDEIAQLLNIDGATISAAQWGFLGDLLAAPAEADLSNVAAGSVTAALLGTNAVTTSKIAPGNIDLSKLSNRSAGEVISYDAAGAPAAIAAGTTGQVLTANTGAAPSFQTITAGAPLPTGIPGVGEFRNVLTALGAAWSLPSGGTWAYSGFRVTSGGTFDTNVSGVAAGSTLVGQAVGNARWRGFEWRVV
ncbi:MAG: hypothetical protein ACTS10_13980 [Kiloniellales bacterium]